MRRLFAARGGLELEHAVGLAGDEFRRKQRKRRQHDDHERDHPVDAQHEKQCSKDRHNTGEQLRKAHQQAVGKLIRVGNDPADQLTARMRVEIGQRKDLKLVKGVAADVAHHAEGDPVIEVAHDPLHDRRCRRDGGNAPKQRRDGQKIHLSRPDDAVDGVADEDGNVERSRDGGRRQQNGQRQQRPAPLDIFQYAPERRRRRTLHVTVPPFYTAIRGSPGRPRRCAGALRACRDRPCVRCPER